MLTIFCRYFYRYSFFSVVVIYDFHLFNHPLMLMPISLLLPLAKLGTRGWREDTGRPPQTGSESPQTRHRLRPSRVWFHLRGCQWKRGTKGRQLQLWWLCQLHLHGHSRGSGWVRVDAPLFRGVCLHAGCSLQQWRWLQQGSCKLMIVDFIIIWKVACYCYYLLFILFISYLLLLIK